MTPDEVGKQLHDRATRGLALSASELALLAEWYARLDEEESRQSGGAPPSSSLTRLQTQVDQALVQLDVAAQRVCALAVENDRLRQEIAVLRHGLA